MNIGAKSGTNIAHVTSAIHRMVRGFLLLVLLLTGVARVALSEPIVPGLAASQLDPDLKGLVLIEELNCVACHPSDAPLAARSKKAPRLAGVGSRVQPKYLEAFIRDPHGTQPGTTMPDVLAHLGGDEKGRVARALTHFLLSLKTNDFFLQPADAVAARHGERLFHSRGCAACHSPRDARGTELLRNTSAPLGPLAGKYSFKSIVDFLRRPHAIRPSGRMPDMRLSGQDLERIAHYLLRDTRVPGHLGYTLYRGDVWEGLGSDNVTAEKAGLVDDFAAASLGKLQHHSALKFEGWQNIAVTGRYRFFLRMNGGSLILDGREIIQLEPSDRRGVKDLEGAADLAAGWRKVQLIYFHTGHEPTFSFEMEGPQFGRQPIPSSMLSISDQPIPGFEPLKADSELAGRGREFFGRFGCARCHDDLGVTGASASALAKLDVGRGCLSAVTGPWPRFDLAPVQREQVANALPGVEGRRLDDRQLLNKTLVTFNCIACHERAGLGSIPAERNANFTGSREALGDQGRLPPPLTHVGAKLKPEWLAEVLLRGQRQRDYLDASMPQFGETNVGLLVPLFGKVDRLESADIPRVADVEESKDAGCQLIGTGGLSCIACHDFNGQPAGGAGALDIVHATGRLQKNWFHLYLREPARFHPTVIMPSYWPGGASARPDILGGNAARQIEALWNYLEDGTHAKKPAGLSRQSRELRVTDVAEIFRGRGPAGYRGIGVGYPQGVNLAFDSEQMSLRLLWKGEFANVDLGSFTPRGTDRISFPPGIPFHRLKSLDLNWPYKGKSNYTFPQDEGYQFRGYHLDHLRRPTFFYQYGKIAVVEFFDDVRGKDGNVWFRRTFRFETPMAPESFYFRAASGRKITSPSERAFVVDQLQLRITSDHRGVVRAGEPGEILIPLTLPAGRSTLSLEYQW